MINFYLDYLITSINLQDYWKTVLEELDISFSVLPQRILKEELCTGSEICHPGGQWLPGAFLNPAKNCLCLNSNRTWDDIMVVWRNEGNDEMPVNKLTRRELCSEVWYLLCIS